ncbi:MAG: hypothetical protein WA117_19525 [Verrucomicrobiia bacterium]
MKQLSFRQLVKKFGLAGALVLIVMFGLLFAPVQARADSYTLTLTNIGYQAVSSTNAALAAEFAVQASHLVAFTTAFQLTNAGTGNITLEWATSADGGTTYESTPSINWTFAANGTNVTIVNTNLDVGAFNSLKLIKIINANTGGAITNMVIKATKKQSSLLWPGSTSQWLRSLPEFAPASRFQRSDDLASAPRRRDRGFTLPPQLHGQRLAAINRERAYARWTRRGC